MHKKLKPKKERTAKNAGETLYDMKIEKIVTTWLLFSRKKVLFLSTTSLKTKKQSLNLQVLGKKLSIILVINGKKDTTDSVPKMVNLFMNLN